MNVGQRVRRAFVIGDGGWGTALALVLHHNGIATTLWSAFPEQAEEIRTAGENQRFLPGVPIPRDLVVTSDPAAIAQTELVVNVVPTQFLREVAQRFRGAIPAGVPIVSASKGLEVDTFQTPREILREVHPEHPTAALIGPTHAEEVARKKPAAALVAATDSSLSATVQSSFGGPLFRIYAGDDPKGAEIAAALKNVIAIAAGISDGLELGDNAKAALLTRGAVEMARFGLAHGAKAPTFFGLAGIGDLVATCCSQHSRNRAVGERIGRGESLEAVLRSMKMVAEGVWTAQALFGPQARAHGVAMPIAQEVHAILFGGRDPRLGVNDLMTCTDVGREMGGLFGGC
jgi:glycerol-3-phosphate dehydrogenase (NAD(P)+)